MHNTMSNLTVCVESEQSSQTGKMKEDGESSKKKHTQKKHIIVKL